MHRTRHNEIMIMKVRLFKIDGWLIFHTIWRLHDGSGAFNNMQEEQEERNIRQSNCCSWLVLTAIYLALKKGLTICKTISVIIQFVCRYDWLTHIMFNPTLIQYLPLCCHCVKQLYSAAVLHSRNQFVLLLRLQMCDLIHTVLHCTTCGPQQKVVFGRLWIRHRNLPAFLTLPHITLPQPKHLCWRFSCIWSKSVCLSVLQI